MIKLSLACAVLAPVSSQALTLHVDAANTHPQPPYQTRVTAAQTIQDAVDAAEDGDTIRVAPGRYDQGGQIRDGQLNRVLVDKAITIRSSGGSLETTIVGARDPNAASAIRGCGPLAVRGVYLNHPQAKLIGFRVTGGATLSPPTVNEGWQETGRQGGGIYAVTTSIIVAQCTIDGNAASVKGGGIYGGLLRHCILADNWAPNGGGAAQAELRNCQLLGNTAKYGGGASECVLRRCDIRDNVADCECDSPESWGGGVAFSQVYDSILHHNMAISGGGAAESSDLWNCTVSDNVAGSGGGAIGGTLRRCILSGNRAQQEGGGTSDSTTYHCTLRDNRAAWGAGCSGGRHVNGLVVDNVASYRTGGADSAQLVNCTVAGNRSLGNAGGTYDCLHVNTIVYDNHADGDPATDNWARYTNPRWWPPDTPLFFSSCTTPLPPGESNTDAPPQFHVEDSYEWMEWKDYRLAADSPCVDAGNATLMTDDLPCDLNGLPRVTGAQIDIGAYEHPGPAPLTGAIYVDAAQTNSPMQDGSRQHPFGTIQAGIDAAEPDGEVLLRTGLYTGPGNRNVSFRGKSIAVHSQDVPGAVVVDCENQDRGFVFNQGETDNALLRGVTILHGMATNGGAIYSSNASPRIEDCVLYDNTAFGFGGAVYAEGGRGPHLTRCRIENNAARIVWQANYWGGQGAGLYSQTELPARIEDSRVVSNRGESTVTDPVSGGIQGAWETVRCWVSGHTNEFMVGIRDATLVENCDVNGNATGVRDVALLQNSRIKYSRRDGVLFTRPGLATQCLIARNSGSGITSRGDAAGRADVTFSEILSNGAAAGCSRNLKLHLSDCRIAGNDSGSGAGMGFIEHIRCTIENNGKVGSTALGAIDFNSCLIRSNRSPAFTATKGGIRLNHCTIVDNGPNPTNGPTLFRGGVNGWIQIRNCIAWNNGTNLYTHEFNPPTAFSGAYSLIQYSSTLYSLGEGSLDEDPQFVSSTDFRLRPTSPCIRAGDPGFAPGGGDLESTPWGSPPAMGAYAFSDPAPADPAEPEQAPDFAIRMIQSPVRTTSEGSVGTQIGWNALPEQTYSLWRSTNLLMGFHPAQTIESGEGGPITWELEEGASSAAAVFYQLRSGPSAP